MKQAIKRMFGSGLPKLAALALAVLATGGAWAAVKPAVVWNGDISTDTLTRNGFTLTTDDNVVADGKITLVSTAKGVTLAPSSGGFGNTQGRFTAVVGYSNIVASAKNGALWTLYTSRDGDTTGVSLNDYGFIGVNLGTANYSLTSSGSYPSDGGLYYVGAYFSTDRATDYSSLGGRGTYTWVKSGDSTISAGKDGLCYSQETSYYGMTFGGFKDESGHQLTNAVISYIAFFTNQQEVAATTVSTWSLSNMKTVGTDLGTATAETGVNLPASATLSAAVTPAAVFVQQTSTLTMTGSASLTVNSGTGPLYVADGTALTIDATGITSLTAQNPSVALVSAKIYGADLITVKVPVVSGGRATASVTESGITLSYLVDSVTFTSPFTGAALAAPTTATAYGESATEISFGNHEKFNQTIGDRTAIVVDITGGTYEKLNGFLRTAENTAADARSKDVYLALTGGTANRVSGVQDCTDWSNAGTTTTTGDSIVQIQDGATVDFVYGAGGAGGYNGYQVVVNGSSGVSIKGGTVRGSVVGGWTSSHNLNPTVNYDTAVLVETVLGTATAATGTDIPAGYIIGGSAYNRNSASASTVGRNSFVTLSLADKSGAFDRTIIGGSAQVGGTTSGNQAVTGNSSVTIIAANDVRFANSIIGGGAKLVNGGQGSVTVGGNSSVTISGGTYTGRIVAGGYAPNGGTANVSGTATLTLNSGVFTGATLDGGNATGAKTLVVGDNLDISDATVTGFTAVTLGDGATAQMETGDEGTATLGSGAVLKLIIEDVDIADGYTPSVSGSGTVEYYEYVESVLTKITDAARLDENNLRASAPVWSPAAADASGNLADTARWSTGAIPANDTAIVKMVVNGSNTLTVNETRAFGHLYIEGSGTLLLEGDGTHHLTVGHLDIASGVTVTINDADDPLYVTDGTIDGSGTLTLANDANLTLDGVTKTSSVSLTVPSGTTLTIGGDGTTTLPLGDRAISGNIVIEKDATLISTTSDAPNYSGSCNVYIYGTLTLNSRWSMNANNKIYCYTGATINGTGDSNAALDLLNQNTTIYVNPNPDTQAAGTVTCSARIRLRGNATVNVAEGMTFLITGNTIKQTDNFGYTKTGAGLLHIKGSFTPGGTTTVSAGKILFEDTNIGSADLPGNLAGSGTVEFKSTSAHDYFYASASGFTGKIIVTKAGSTWPHIIGTAPQTSSETPPELEVSGGVVLTHTLNNASFYVKDLSGSGTIDTGYGTIANNDHTPRTIDVLLTKNSAFGGIFSYSDNSYKHRNACLTVRGADDAESVYALTLSGVSTSYGQLMVQNNAKVVFTSAGSWLNGSVTVGNGGWLESTNATVLTSLTLADGANIVFPTSSSALTGITSLTFESGTTYISFADGVTPTAGTLIDWSGASLESAPAGDFQLVGSVAGDWIPTKSETGLSIAASAAKVTPTTGYPVAYSSVETAIAAFATLINTDDGASLTILDGTTLTEQEVTQLAQANIYYDSSSGVLTKAVAKVGQTCYPSLASAISDGAAVTLLRNSSEAITLNVAITLTETAAYSGTLSGSGTLTLTALRSSALAFGEWTGTVVLPAIDSIAGDTFNFNNYGKSGSTVRVTTIGGGWLSGETINPAIDIETSFALTDFSASRANTFTKITGSGAFSVSSSAASVDVNNEISDKGWSWYNGCSAYFLVNDISEFCGSIAVTNVGLAIGSSKPAYNTLGGKIIINSGEDVTVATGKTWTAPGGFCVNGDLTIVAGASLVGNGTTLAITGSGTVVQQSAGTTAEVVALSGTVNVAIEGATAKFGTGSITMADSAVLAYDPGVGNTNTMGSAITDATVNNKVKVTSGTLRPTAGAGASGAFNSAEIDIENGGELLLDYTNDLTGYNRCTAPIRIKTGGIMNVGRRETMAHDLYLEGGQLKITGVESNRGIDLFSGRCTIYATENSEIFATGNYPIYVRDNNATISVSPGKTLTCNCAFVYHSAVDGYDANSKSDIIKDGEGTLVMNGYNGEAFALPRGINIQAGIVELNVVQNSNGQTGANANFYTVASGAKLKIGATGQANTTTLTLNNASLLEFGGSGSTSDAFINADTTTFASGTVTISFSSGVTPTDGAKLISWSALPDGTFQLDSSLASSYALVSDDSGLRINSGAAVVNGTAYATLQAAIDASGDDDVITLLKNNTESITIAVGRVLKIEKGSYTCNNPVAATGGWTISAGEPVEGVTTYTMPVARVITYAVASTNYFASVDLSASDDSARLYFLTSLATDESAIMEFSTTQDFTSAVLSDLATYNVYFDGTTTLSKAVAKSGTTTYGSLAAAVSDVSSGATIELLRNSSESITLDKTITLTETATFSGTFTGSGTLVMTALPKALDSARWASGWTGTLWLKNVAFSNLNPGKCGNATSTLKMSGCSGKFNEDYNVGNTFAGTLELEDEDATPALTITDGFPVHGVTTIGALKGSGTLKSGDSQKAQCFIFGSASGFTGTITILPASSLRVVFGTGSESSYRKIFVKSGATATVAAGKTWTAPAGFEVRGTMKVADTGVLSGDINVANGGVFEVDSDPTGSAEVAMTMAGGARYRLAASASTDIVTNKLSITFNGTESSPSILDANGNRTFVFDLDDVSGSGSISVANSYSGGTGKVKFIGGGSFGGKVVMDASSAQYMDVSEYEGTIYLIGISSTYTAPSLEGFSGTLEINVSEGTLDAREIDLSDATVMINSSVTYIGYAGKEGHVELGNPSAVLQLYVTNEQYLYDGYVIKGSVVSGATVTYFHREDSESEAFTYSANDEFTPAENEVSRADNNLIPYYKRFAGDYSQIEDGSYYGTLSTLSHWGTPAPGSSGAPTTGNIAIQVQGNKRLSVNIDNTTTFGEVQIYGSGTVILSGSGAMTITNGLYVTSGANVEIVSGVTMTGANGISTRSGVTTTISCGTADSPYVVPRFNGWGSLVISQDAYASVGNVPGQPNAITVRGTLILDDAGEVAVLMPQVLDTGKVYVKNGTTLAGGMSMIVNGSVFVDENSNFEPYASTTLFSGSGMIQWAGALPTDETLLAKLQNTTVPKWTGTSWFTNCTDLVDFVPQTYGNAGSVVRLTGVTGTFDEGNTCNVPVELCNGADGSAALEITGGDNESTLTFAEIRGTGTLKTSNLATSPTMNIKVLDWSAFAGGVDVWSSRVVFGSDELGYVDHGVDVMSDLNIPWGSIYVSTNATVTIPTGATWSGTGGLTVAGTLDVNDTTMLGQISKFVANSKLVLRNSAVSTQFLILPSDGRLCINFGNVVGEGAVGTPVITGISACYNFTLADGKFMWDRVYFDGSYAFPAAESMTGSYGIVAYEAFPVPSDADGSPVAVPAQWISTTGYGSGATSAEYVSEIATAINGRTYATTGTTPNGCTYLESYALGLTPSNAASVPTADMTVNGDNFEIYLSNAVVPKGVTLTLSAATKTPGGTYDDAGATPVSVNGNNAGVSGTKVIVPIPTYDPEDPEADPVNLYRLKVGISGTTP